MNLVAFYHIWAGGAWGDPLNDYLVALDGRPSYFVVVGAPDERKLVQETGIVPVEFAEMGGEAVTINALHEYAQTHKGAIMYAHSKGSSPGALRDAGFTMRWRRSMLKHVVKRWHICVQLLEHCDAVGCHWLTKDHDAVKFGETKPPFFGGNFWAARCDYLRDLPPCPLEPRWDAESWIGQNNPRVVDLLPGWPYDHYAAARV
jgi:hypothetical protein